MKRIVLILVILVILCAGAAGVYWFGSDNSAGESAGGSGAESAAELASNEGADGTNEEQAGEEQADDEESDGPTAIPVNVADVRRGAVSTYITATANLVAEDEVNVLAEAEGRITRLLVEEGDAVEAGQLLATLLRDEAEMAYNKAQLRASNAKMNFERSQRMAQDELVAREEFDRVKMEHRIAQQELAEAKWALDKTEIRAPFDGRVTARNITLGNHVRPGDELFIVTSFDPLISRIFLPERDVLDLTVGREVDITLKADEEVHFDGRIRQISPVVDTATGTVKVTVEAVAPPADVRPGGFVIIDIVRETREDAVVVPRKAVLRELKLAHVFVAKDDVAEKRAVELGLEEDEQLEVVSGLEPGERIVVAGQGALKDGSKIKVLTETSDTRAANMDGGAATRG